MNIPDFEARLAAGHVPTNVEMQAYSNAKAEERMKPTNRIFGGTKWPLDLHRREQAALLHLDFVEVLCKLGFEVSPSMRVIRQNAFGILRGVRDEIMRRDR